MKDFATQQTDRVFFAHVEGRGWVIEYANDIKHKFSVNNNWTLDRKKAKVFEYLHQAVQVAKKRCFRYTIPDYRYELRNNNMHIFYNNEEMGHVKEVKSDKQAQDFMRDMFNIQCSKMKGL